MQRNNFAHTATVTPGGDVESGTDCVSVTRWSSCDDCGHVWAETVATKPAYAESLRPTLVGAVVSGIIDNAINAVQAPQQPAQEQIVQAGTTAARASRSS